MIGYVAFFLFWVVFLVVYINRDKTIDQERLDNFWNKH